MDVLTFIHHYLQHVLPKGFVKVRYMGLYAHAAKQKRERAMKALPKYKENGNGKNNREARMAGNGHGPKMEKQSCCPKCKQPVTFVKTMPEIYYYSNGRHENKLFEFLFSMNAFLFSRNQEEVFSRISFRR